MLSQFDVSQIALESLTYTSLCLEWLWSERDGTSWPSDDRHGHGASRIHRLSVNVTPDRGGFRNLHAPRTENKTYNLLDSYQAQLCEKVGKK